MTRTMTSLLMVTVLLVTVSISLCAAKKSKECLDECKVRKTNCDNSCANYLLGPDVCQSICNNWDKRCLDECPDAPVQSAKHASGKDVLATVTCQSGYGNGLLHMCPVPQATPEMSLKLKIKRKLADFDCIEGVSYGLVRDNSVIWTSNGCSAKFSVKIVDSSSSASQEQLPKKRPHKAHKPKEQPPKEQQPPRDSWTEWGACSVTCGQGRRSRSRLAPCDPGVSAAYCATRAEREYELKSCALQSCDTAAQQPQEPQEPETDPKPQAISDDSEWTEWTACTVTCGQGRNTRSRQVCRPGRACRRLHELRRCNRDPCPDSDTSSDGQSSSQSGGQSPSQSGGQSSSQSGGQSPSQSGGQSSSQSGGQSSSQSGGQSSSPTCGRANLNRIVGGTRAGQCQYPWMVLLYNQVTNNICGGSILGKRDILTAGHCLYTLNERTGRYEMAQANHLLVLSGATTMPLDGQIPDAGFTRNYVLDVTLHPQYDPYTVRNDIALLKLRADLPENECHKPVCLVSGQENPQDAKSCRTMGWGKTSNSETAQASSTMNWAGVDITSRQVCQSTYRFGDPTTTLCAGGGGSDSCSGDSGGPLVCLGDGGSYYQYGIVSLGVKDQCGIKPGLYTRVSAFLSWIGSHTA